MVCGGLSRRPPRPPRVPAALAAVLSEAGGCGREAWPEIRAVGGDRNVRSGRKPTGGSAPYDPRMLRCPAHACRARVFVGERPAIRSPTPPLVGAGRFGRCASRREGHPPPSTLPPPHGQRLRCLLAVGRRRVRVARGGVREMLLGRKPRGERAEAAKKHGAPRGGRRDAPKERCLRTKVLAVTSRTIVALVQLTKPSIPRLTGPVKGGIHEIDRQ